MHLLTDQEDLIKIKTIFMPTAKLKMAIKQYAAMSFIIHQNGNNLSGGAPPVLLMFNMQLQVENQWCWAATSASVSIFYNSGSTWTQCLVACSVLRISTCCAMPTPCNKPWYLDQALSVTNNFVNQSGQLTFQNVESELLNGRVLGVRVGWYGGGGHFMVIYGCKTTNGVNYYNIDDPIYGKSLITEAAFQTAYQGAGSWTHSYNTKG